LFNNIKKVLGCGFIIKRSNQNMVYLNICKFEDICKIMILIFNKHKIIGVKSLDYLDFCLVAKLVDKKSHLTLKGLEKIRKIILRMNINRY
jgi:hypothetical protein